MSQTITTEEVHDKNGVTCPVWMRLSWAMVLKLSKMCSLCNLMLTSARNLGLL